MDDEVVRTDTRSYHDIKIGITGSIRPSHKSDKKGMVAITEDEKQPGSPPKSVFPSGFSELEKDNLQESLETVVTVEEDENNESRGNEK